MNKQQLITELEEVCKKHGFNLKKESAVEYSMFTVEEKDIWDGVEYIEWIDPTNEFFIEEKIYRLLSERYFYTYSETGSRHSITPDWFELHFKPSTQAAYEAQLKRIAQEKYGYISTDDVFERINPNKGITRVNDIKYAGYAYHKNNDRLYYGMVLLYENGRWAKKVEKVKVEYFFASSVSNGKFGYVFKIENYKSLEHEKIGKFLANELEHHLNNPGS